MVNAKNLIERLTFMKRKNIFDMLLGCLLLSSCTHLKSAVHLNREDSMPVDDTSTWKVVFDDEFNSGQGLDTSKWTFCTRGKAAWAKYLTPGWDYAYQDGKHLILKMFSPFFSFKIHNHHARSA